jgi:phenylacetate-CoA ligase
MWLLDSLKLAILHKLENSAYQNYQLYRWGLEHLPANINSVGLEMAWQAFEQARQDVPAYREFLQQQGFIDRPDLPLAERYARIPAIDKNNYVRLFTTADRCVNGQIPAAHVVVDESSGSTGLPYNWVRSQTELERTKRSCSFFHRYYFGDEPLFIINAFSMGAWATGVTVGAAMSDNGIVKSTGPDIEKILHTLRFFGPKYRYLITGYPPFLKHLLDYADGVGFDWSGYRLVATVGGEGMSENLRSYLLRRFEKVFSGYGASDLEIGVAGETEVSVIIRKLMATNAQVRQAILGTDEHRIPMLFQYNPLDHYIEVNARGELLVTITRQLLSPRIRYNVKDEGGVLSFAEMQERLQEVGIDIFSLLPTGSNLPKTAFLYLYGRRDSTLSYMGANLYPEDIEAGLLDQPELAALVGAFAMELLETSEATGEVRPCIHVEVKEGYAMSESVAQALTETVRRKLYEVNADFREAVHEDATAAEIQVKLHASGSGPFAVNNGRIKQAYVVKNKPAQPQSVNATFKTLALV